MRIARRWLNGFFLLGVLLGVLGPLLVVWQYHIDVEPQLIGLHFLALNAGFVVAAISAERLLGKVSLRALAIWGCSLALASLTTLIFVAPPLPVGWRLLTLAVLGMGGGVLTTSLIYGSAQAFREALTSTLMRAGVLFGSGCLLSAGVVAASYSLGPLRLETALLALVPLLFLPVFALAKSTPPPPELRGEPGHDVLRDLRSIAIVLLSLLLFFQFGNEWVIAGWLPVFLVHRLGSNPALAIGVLAIYFLVLTVGRLAAQKLVRRVNQRRLLLLSVGTAMCGFLLLSIAGSLTGAALGAVVVGAGFAPIYPLMAEQLDHRFTFHPGFYHSTVSIAMTGAMSLPWLLGFVAAWLGMRYVMWVPALGSAVVLFLSLLLMFEAHLMNGRVHLPSDGQ